MGEEGGGGEWKQWRWKVDQVREVRRIRDQVMKWQGRVDSGE